MSTAEDRGSKADRRRRVEALYHEMLARPPDERAAALAAACPDDPALAAEVQSLFDGPESAAAFPASAALDVAAPLVAGTGSALTGRRVGVFEVQGLLGVGGMGEVYRARDTRLGRSVAIKILPRAFKDDPERMVRFQREARVLASLNHPNIGTLYGLEDAGDLKALVLELVEGEDLSERLRRGAIPTNDAIAIARQIAEGLEEAHDKGIVHRDLKPTNIKITPEGRVKILDFGLAKALESGNPGAAHSGISEPPTWSRHATEAGVILGTAAYMSPEQARGTPVDKRADIWSFGVVLFEMLAGKRPFTGETQSDTLVAVLTRAPDWSALPASISPSARRLLQRCLERDARQRLRDIGEARVALGDSPSAAGLAESTVATVGSLRPARSALVAMFSVALIATISVGLWFLRSVSTPHSSDLSIESAGHFSLPLPEGTLLANISPSVAISRDGTRLALVAEREGVRSLFVRGIDESKWRQLPGTEGAMGPFFSPDRDWLAFFAPGKLLRVPLTGGMPQVVCESTGLDGYARPTGDWGEDGRIVFSHWPVPDIRSVPATGGVAVPLARLGPGSPHSVWYRRPRPLSGGRGLLVGILTGDRARVEILPPDPGERRVLIDPGTDGTLTRTGHLVYHWNNQLLAVAFDSDKYTAGGVPVPVVEGVRSSVGQPLADYSLSENGTLVYAPAPRSLKRLVWADRAGRVTPLAFPPRNYRFPSLSPEGDRIAAPIWDGPKSDIWIGDVRRGILSRLTRDEGMETFSLWSPDGRYVLFSASGPGPFNVFRKLADGTGEAERLTTSPNHQRATGFSPDGRLLVFNDQDPVTAQNIWALPMNGGKPVLLVGSSATERSGVLSPDGRWLAYDSDESGRYEVYVLAYPDLGDKRQVSTEGGGNPMWNPNGRELFFTNEDRFMSLTFPARGPLQTGTPRLLFRSPMVTGEGPGRREYDVARNGEHFLFVEETTSPELHVVVNWFEELKRRVPVARSPQPRP